jgi:hypothetical protein
VFDPAIKYGLLNTKPFLELFNKASNCLGKEGKGCNCSKDQAQKILDKYIMKKSFWEGFLMMDLTWNLDGATSPYTLGGEIIDSWRNNFYTYTNNIDNKIGFVSWD